MLETHAPDRRVDDTQGTWQMPQVRHCHWNSYHNDTTAWLTWHAFHVTLQGGMDILENPFNTAERELLEETGISSIVFLAQVDLDFISCVQT